MTSLKTHSIILALVFASLMTVPVSSADHWYCGDHVQMCCGTNSHGGGGAMGIVTTAIAQSVIVTCQATDNSAGLAMNVLFETVDLVNCILYGNC